MFNHRSAGPFEIGACQHGEKSLPKATAPTSAQVRGLFEDELLQVLHACGKLVVVLAKGADVPVRLAQPVGAGNPTVSS